MQRCAQSVLLCVAASCAEPDDLAFLALWKRYMTRKQQLVSAAADSEPLQRANQQLRGSLQEAHNTIVSLKAKMSELELARSAAVAAKAGLEQKLLEVQTEKESLQVGQPIAANAAGVSCAESCGGANNIPLDSMEL